jgi:hypothetical protein
MKAGTATPDYRTVTERCGERDSRSALIFGFDNLYNYKALQLQGPGVVPE